MDKQDLLDKYLEGSLSEAETNVFNSLRKSDPDFDEQVNFQDDLAEVVLEDERRRLKTLLLNRKSNITNSKNPNKWILIGLGILLLLATIILVRYVNSGNPNEAIYASFYEPLPNSYRPVSRNSINNAETQGFTAYESENYVLAAEKFEERLKDQYDLSIVFYQGICYGENGDLDAAIQNLEKIKGKEFPYATESQYYLGLYYLKQNNKTESIRNLQDFIQSGKDEELIQNAKAILDKIEK
ncbi:tetratricopeptide repeat protein [Portibacter lacus]|uniref:Tetratricopeptide repeat protein n=1 Tax=Portibacter lacus TaxID=1099794 RepID=A0AA37WHS8_9BACT|nr:tetratricopeptide repeat protein [Portibacter lacus]GLR19889.1 hypothetical protein GCM10007940_45050 [Portibacter lacus]